MMINCEPLTSKLAIKYLNKSIMSHIAQLSTTCLKSTMETAEQCIKYVQS